MSGAAYLQQFEVGRVLQRYLKHHCHHMSSSVTISIITNSLITVSKGIGWAMTGSPTLFAETIHSLADVGNQVLLKVGEVRASGPASDLHPFGRGQERYFWALVSAVSVFFIGCGITVYHGVHSLLSPGELSPFTLLPICLLLFSLVLEAFTFVTAWREIGGWRGLSENRSNTAVLAVLMEDAVALFGIVLTLLVAGLSLAFGPMPVLDASISIIVGVILGGMAIFLANLNRQLLIDVADIGLNHALSEHLGSLDSNAEVAVSSLIVDDGRYVVFVRMAKNRATGNFLSGERSRELGEELKRYAASTLSKTIDAVYWKFPGGSV